MKKDSLGDRMKRYESVYKTKLIPRSYTIIRIDGKAFHSYTKNLKKPFDRGLVDNMIETTKYLCENIQGCKLAYVQSDEISLLLTDFDTHETQAWFDNEIPKMLSISASLATAKFNQLRMIRYSSRHRDHSLSSVSESVWDNDNISTNDLKNFKLAYFDSRVFQVPNLSEAYNYFLWRQQDAVRNSISACAQALYSHKELHKKSQSDMKEMISQKGIEFRRKMTICGYPELHRDNYMKFKSDNVPLKGIQLNWNDLPEHLKRGTAISKEMGEWVSFPIEFNSKFFELNIIDNI